ncbi:unnamed protein product [Urochloa decumbens]|uniref:Fe2OG dioxygenase domain-containing protein n=1 Tax=Urochloa decumbens TaxID=240449 RepID=A0ABC9DET5_9POAL
MNHLSISFSPHSTLPQRLHTMSSLTEAVVAVASYDGYDRRRELQAFDDTKAGVRGLLDAGVTSIPAIFHHPPDSLPQHQEAAAATPIAAAPAVPVIDLQGAPREEVVGLVRAAAETAGFFQVVNHGVPADAMAAMIAAVRRFNEQPAEAKRPYYTRDTAASKARFYSNLDLFQSPAACWRDTVFCDMAPEPPLPEELPEPLRGVMFEYTDAVRKLAVWVFELLSESLGLAGDHLSKLGCGESLKVAGNYYPPCPEPHLTLGNTRHTDPTFLTVLLQDGVGGLQVFLDHAGAGGWVDVPPVPGALIINAGDLLQLVSNGRFRSVEHRVLANKSSTGEARVSVAAFVDVGRDRSVRRYGPIEELLTPGNPPLYRSVTVEEFISHFYRKGSERRPRLDYFKLEQ